MGEGEMIITDYDYLSEAYILIKLNLRINLN